MRIKKDRQGKSVIAYHLFMMGRVQGVGMRAFVRRCALDHRITGWVRNTPDGNVECFAQGSLDALNAFARLVSKGYGLSRVDHVTISAVPLRKDIIDFHIT